jgi:N-acetylmuramoyl-L-alanine amidase
MIRVSIQVVTFRNLLHKGSQTLSRFDVLRPLAAGSVIAFLTVINGCESVPPSQTAAPLRSPVRSGAALPPVAPVQSVVIDAGHGGHDPGTSHYGYKEKYLALDIARRLRANLQAHGLNVVMTRESDKFIPLSGRPAVANRMRADLFVSVHINANRSRSVSGAEVYYPRESVVGSSAHWPPSVASSDVGVPSMTVKQVLWDLVLGRTRSRSRRLAASVCRTMREGMHVACKTKSARFVVLREAWMPAVLVEVGYVSNQMEASRLGTAEYRAAAAASIANGIRAYIRDLGVQHI